jgi:hypothetical protein
MKKKFKEIDIDGQKYGWIIKNDKDGNLLRIYKDKKIIYEKVIIGEVTSKLISDMIFTNR